MQLVIHNLANMARNKRDKASLLLSVLARPPFVSRHNLLSLRDDPISLGALCIIEAGQLTSILKLKLAIISSIDANRLCLISIVCSRC